MIKGWFPVFLREVLILRRRFLRVLASMVISPSLYLIAFRYVYSNGSSESGCNYLTFLVAGLIAIISMNQAWSIATDINVARFYWHVFEEFQAAPIPKTAYVLGEVLAGMLRSFLGVLLILLLAIGIGVALNLSFWFWLAVSLNSFTFASLAVAMAMLVKSHADQTLLSNFLITPMSFLGGTLVPVERFPNWAQGLIDLLPLTHAARIIRAAALGQLIDYTTYFFLSSLGIIFFILAIYSINMAQE